jgi:hypothetical protein
MIAIAGPSWYSRAPPTVCGTAPSVTFPCRWCSSRASMITHGSGSAMAARAVAHASSLVASMPTLIPVCAPARHWQCRPALPVSPCWGHAVDRPQVSLLYHCFLRQFTIDRILDWSVG